MDFINSIGQRKTSKLLCGVTFVISLILQVLAYGAVYAATLALWMGCALITLPNILLSMGAHFTRKYRIHCIYAQLFLVVVNFLVLLVVPTAFLLPIFVGQIIVTAVLALVLYAMPSQTVQPKRRSSSSRSSSGSNRSSSKNKQEDGSNTSSEED